MTASRDKSKILTYSCRREPEGVPPGAFLCSDGSA